METPFTDNAPAIDYSKVVLETPIGFTKMGRLDDGPKHFIERLLGEEETADYFNFGKLVHAVTFQPNLVDEMFYISAYSAKPGKWTTFVEHLYETRDLKGTDEWYANAYEVAELASPKLPGAIKKFEDEMTLGESYYDVLALSEGKTTMTPEDLIRAEKCRDALTAYKSSLAKYLELPTALVTPKEEELEVFVEEEIEWKAEGFEFLISSTLDMIVIDHTRKMIIIIDLKTTSVNVYKKFVESYEKYGYYRQGGIYLPAFVKGIKAERPELKDYSIDYVIAAVQVTAPHSVGFFRPGRKDLEAGYDEFIDSLHRLKWHVDNNEWDLPKEFALAKDGVVELNLYNDAENTRTKDQAE